jgi:hypothetical protein
MPECVVGGWVHSRAVLHMQSCSEFPHVCVKQAHNRGSQDAVKDVPPPTQTRGGRVARGGAGQSVPTRPPTRMWMRLDQLRWINANQTSLLIHC